MTPLSIFLQAAPAQGNNWSLLIMMSMLFVVFYFFMIRPQQKKAKDAKKFRESLQKGSKVVTIGGLHGKVVEVNEKTILIEADTNVRLRFEKSPLAGAISALGSQLLSMATLVLYRRYVSDTLSGVRAERREHLERAGFALADKAQNQRLSASVLGSGGELFETPVNFLSMSPEQA